MNELIMPDWLNQRVALSPDSQALIYHDKGEIQSWTFRELQYDVLALASRLEKLVAKGQNIALLLGNSPNFVITVHALMQLDAVIVPLNTRLTPAELSWQLSDVDAKLLISDPQFSSQLSYFSQHNPDLNIFRLSEQVNKSQEIDVEAAEVANLSVTVTPRKTLNLSNMHTIIYSSGTTGRPKGVMLSYNNHWWSAIGSSLNLGNYPTDKWLAVLPLFHVGGLSILFKSVIYGIPVDLHSRFDEVSVNYAVDHDGVTIASVVSTMLVRMLDERKDQPFPSSLRCLLLGGGPAPKPLLERCAAIGAPVVQSYGMTETASQNTTLAPKDALVKLGSAGKPLFPNNIAIDNPDSEGIGEIFVQGPTVSVGYWKRPEETANSLREGWLHTGDLGRIDSQGFLYVVDRRSDLIISGGENIYPAEVEATLLAHPAVAEAGVFGIPDERWGQVVAAVIRLKTQDKPGVEQIKTFCSQRLARYKIPAVIFYVPNDEPLPRNASGKLLRRELREKYKSE